jgi:hypothetical protein
MHEMVAIARQRYVPLVFVPCDIAIARTRFHHMGGSFVRHLEASAAAGGILKGDLTSYLAPGAQEMEELEGYLRVKFYNLQERYALVGSMGEQERAAFLQKVLEAPLHVARKVLAHQRRLHDDSKQAVIREYQSLAQLTSLNTLFRRLVALDGGYTTELQQQITCPNRGTYEHYLDCIQSETPTLLHFIRGNIQRLTEGSF